MEIIALRPDRRLPDVVAIGSFLRGSESHKKKAPQGGGARIRNKTAGRVHLPAGWRLCPPGRFAFSATLAPTGDPSAAPFVKYPRTVRSIPVAGQTLSDAIHRPRAVRAGAPVFRRLKRCFAATARPNRRRPIANHRQPVLVLSHATPGTHSPKTFLHEVVRRASRPTVGSVCIRRLSGSRSRVKSSHMPPLSVAASFQRLTASPSLWPRPVIISPQ
jgi:hypothetical protein